MILDIFTISYAFKIFNKLILNIEYLNSTPNIFMFNSDCDEKHLTDMIMLKCLLVKNYTKSIKCR